MAAAVIGLPFKKQESVSRAPPPLRPRPEPPPVGKRKTSKPRAHARVRESSAGGLRRQGARGHPPPCPREHVSGQTRRSAPGTSQEKRDPLVSPNCIGRYFSSWSLDFFLPKKMLDVIRTHPVSPSRPGGRVSGVDPERRAVPRTPPAAPVWGESGERGT